MKKSIAILLSCSLGLAVSAGAKDDPKKKAAPKSRPVQVQKQQHINAGPKTQHVNAGPKTQHVNAGPKTQHVNVQKQQHINAGPKTQHVNVQKQQHLNAGPKVHQNNVPKHNELSKSTHVQSNELRTNKAPKLDKNITPNTTNVVAHDNLRKNVKTAALPKERIDQIRAQHQNFHARPNAKIASARFNQNYQIAGAHNWSGPQYRAFSSYRPQWHDQGWYHSHYSSNILLIGGGWYFWNAGYWYPAWGYDQSASYYPYDGPIYVGDNPRPFDQVVADCQATLQEQGYYQGDVDGLMGPLTRDALASFQRDHGLITTAALDQPTLSSLGLG